MFLITSQPPPIVPVGVSNHSVNDEGKGRCAVVLGRAAQGHEVGLVLMSMM